MVLKNKPKYLVFVLVVIVTLFFSCNKKVHYDGLFATGYNDVIARDTLVVVTATNSTDYFIYRGNPMGFQLELFEKFAVYLGVELKVVVENDVNKSIAMLMTGQCDLIAQNQLTGKCKLSLITYSEPLASTQLVLVQRGNINPITDSSKLDGKTIVIPKSTIVANNIKAAAQKWNIELNVIEIDSLSADQILEEVSKGKYDFTVIDENIALLYSNYFNINIGLNIGGEKSVSWALPRHSDQLYDTLNVWIESNTNQNTFKPIYNKYYRHRLGDFAIDYSEYINNRERISPFDDIIKIQSKNIGWDWRLLASLIYQESKFNPTAVSWAGAFGIMQLMPQTAALFGIDENSDVNDHVAAGVELIKTIDRNIPETVCDTLDRICFTLAAYNLGYSHVNDAILLTGKYGRNPDMWKNNVDVFLMNLSDPKFYADSVVTSGYCPGRLTVAFVDEILERYKHYCNIIPD